MKQLFLAFSVAAMMMACNQNKEEKTETKAAEAVKVDSASAVADTTHATAHAEYACPMKCEKDKTYPEAGKCPVCKMDLAKK